MLAANQMNEQRLENRVVPQDQDLGHWSSYLKKKHLLLGKSVLVSGVRDNMRFFKVGGPMNKILVLRNKRVFKGLAMLWSSFGGTTRKLFLQVGQAFDWLNFKMANDMSVYSFDSVHQKLKSKRREQGTENDI